jgi:DNA-binding MarR family transcriptional regulator
MDRKKTEAFHPLSLSVRSLFHKLGSAVTALHEGSGVSVGMRAVLESVIAGGPQTVPQMARARPVSRQHIQTLVNELLAAGYVEYLDNPAHRRSKLVRITKKGRKLFSSLRERENEALSRLSVDVTIQELEDAGHVLSVLIERFQSTEWRTIVNDLSPNSKE